jgi:hypothetical protein
MNCNNTIVVVSRFKEDPDFLKKLDFKTLIYEKENPLNKYNVEKNKGNEASVYLKYIIDHYDNLSEYTIFLHCHDISWHHEGSIINIINNNKNIHHTYTNLNNFLLGNMEDLDKSNNDIGIYFRTFIRPAVGPNLLYPNFTKGVKGSAQFIVHKNNILNHSKLFYQNIYEWLMETPIDNYWNGRFLEWTWDLFWNKCLENIPIRKYLGEQILDVSIGSDEENLKKKNMILQFLNENNYYYVDDEIKLITNYNNYTCKNQYIYNKFV